MKKRPGSAIFIVILFIALISGLLLIVQYRCSLLLETVHARESTLQIIYARQALMLYAVMIAKHNWHHINDEITKKGTVSYTGIAWPVTPEKRVGGSVHYTTVGPCIHIKVELERYKPLSCNIQKGLDTPVYSISEWSEQT